MSSMIESFDRDGAVRETAEEAAASFNGEATRGAFLRKAAVGAGALGLAGALAGGLPSIARGATIPASDIAILNFALTLEYLEAEFYAVTIQNAKLKDPKLQRFAEVVRNHEAVHVTALKKTLGAKAVAKPVFDFKGTTDADDTFAATADVLENTGVHAYLGQAGLIKTKAVLAAAAAILPVEARHAAWIRDIRFGGGTNPATTPAPAAFEEGYSKAKILAAVKATGFIVG